MTLDELIPPEERLASAVRSPTDVAGVTQNSAAVLPGSLFFAVRGHKVDGHAFVSKAVSAGAAAVCVERKEVFDSLPNGVLVESTRRAFGLAAARWHGDPTASLALCGVTGTNGKTTTTFLLRHLWDKAGILSGLLGTVQYAIGKQVYDSQLTTPDPLSLQELFHRMKDAGATHGAMEVSSIALDQWRVAGCHFGVVVFTNLTQDHLDYHGTMESYYEAKRRLFTEFSFQRAVINVDDPFGRRLAREALGGPLATFSVEGSDADYYVSDLRTHRDGMGATLHGPTGTWPLALPLIGKHNLSNAMAALVAAEGLGMSMGAAVAAMADAVGAPGRLERVMQGAAYPLIFVDYAHTDDALRNLLGAVQQLRGDGKGRIFTVFGCGGDRDRTKRPKMAAAARELSDVVIATSDNPRTEDPDRILDDVLAGHPPDGVTAHRVVNRREAIGLALRLAKSADIVVIAGKGHETYQIVGTEKFPFDDREVVRDYYHSLCTPGSR